MLNGILTRANVVHAHSTKMDEINVLLTRLAESDVRKLLGKKAMDHKFP